LLNTNFNDTLYDALLRHKVIEVNKHDYFDQFIDRINLTKGKGYTGKEIQPFEDFVLYNFAILVYYL